MNPFGGPSFLAKTSGVEKTGVLYDEAEQIRKKFLVSIYSIINQL